MADVTFGIGIAVGIQSALGTVNSTIAALSGALDSTDGIVLGDGDSGDAASGITIHTTERVKADVADVPSSFTKQASSFIRADVTGLAITIQLKGNGGTATPAAGEALPGGSGLSGDANVGIDALWQLGGLEGANGTAPVYNYTPRADTKYGTLKLWVGDLSYVFQDCLCESVEFDLTPAAVPKVTFNFAVGSHDPATQFADGVSFPTFDYGTQQSVSAPSVVGVANAWGQTRGWNTLAITIENNVDDTPDANQATGIRKAQTERTISVSGAFWVDSTDSDFGYQKTVGATAPTEDMTFQVGTAAGASDPINAFAMTLANLEVDSRKENRIGTALVEEIEAHCTATTAGGEFTLAYN